MLYPFFGFELSGTAVFGAIAAYVLLSLFAIVFIPRRAVRAPITKRAPSLDAQAKLIELRSKVRQSVLQVVGGVTAVFAFIVTLQQIRQNEDTFKGKKADLFSKSITSLFDEKSHLNSRAGAMYLLSYVARSDPSYHRTVFDTLAGHIILMSSKACRSQMVTDSKTYQREPQIQLALRIIGERNPDHDPTGKRFNLENSCLVDVDLRDEVNVVKGLRKARLSDSQLLRSDFTNADLSGAELRRIKASDYMNKEQWTVAIGFELNRGVDGDQRGAIDYATDQQRRQFITMFTGANLAEADFQDAELAGADFRESELRGAIFLHANIARASFVRAKNIEPDQMMKACVGQPGMDEQEFEAQQPYFSAAFLKKLGGKRIPRCKAEDDHSPD